MKPNERKIKFSSLIQDEDGYKHPETKVEVVSTGFTKRYKNTIYLLCQLTPCERALMDYLTEIMTQDNIVSNNLGIRQQFVNNVERCTVGKVKFQDGTVRHSFMVLQQKGFLISIPGGRGSFIVNPKYFWNSNDEFSRINYVQIILEFQHGARTKVDINRGKNGKIYSDVKVE